MKNLSVSILLSGILATSAMAVVSPDFPLAGWATQNGNTTGGAGKPTVTVDNVDDLRKYAEVGNYTIYVKPNTYKVPSKSAIKVGDNVTIYGYRGAIIEQTRTSVNKEDNTALNITGKNIIIRNLTFKGAGSYDLDAGDCLHVQGGVNVWIDHVDVYDGQDGNLDVINGANYVTISWTKFHYTSASSNHQFSNLIGNDDKKTTDAGKLKTTLHHNWWADGSKERMPRVRYGQVHVVNNLFNSNNASYCIRAGMKADIRAENNVFIGVKNPLDYNSQATEDALVSMVGNYYEKISGNTTGQGIAFTPPYNMGITDISTQAKAYLLRDSIMFYSGATLPNPGSNEAITPMTDGGTSSSSTVSSSSSIRSSASSSNSSSSASMAGEATLTKHGTGPSSQTVEAGDPIQEFYYTISGATGATVTGLPAGVSGTLKGSDFYISGTVSATAEAKVYNWTLTTTGASRNVSKSGSITVVASKNTSSSSTESSSASVNEPESNATDDTSSSSDKVSESSSSQDKPQVILPTAGKPLNISVVDHSLFIEGAQGKPFAIFDMQGRIFDQGFVCNNSFVKVLPISGSYLIKIGQTNHSVVVR